MGLGLGLADRLFPGTHVLVLVFLLPVLVSAQREEAILVFVAFWGAFTGSLGACGRGWRGGGACSPRRCLSRRGKCETSGAWRGAQPKDKRQRHKKKRGGTASHLQRPGRLELLGRIVRQSAVARAGLLNARLVCLSARVCTVRHSGSVGPAHGASLWAGESPANQHVFAWVPPQ